MDERCPSTGLVRHLTYAVMGEMHSERHHVDDLYSQKEATT